MLKRSILVVAIALTSCFAPNYHSLQNEIVTTTKSKNYTKAFEIIDKNYDKKESSLLNNLEKGTLYYIEKNYEKSLEHFDEAERISEELYTISLTSELKNVLNDSFDNYSGKKYELGLIRFYKSLIYYNLYLSTKDISYLRKSRSNIMNWNSLNNSYTDEDYYKNDLLQKIWGAFIYANNNDEREKTSLKSAKKALFNYGVYPTYNSNSNAFRENFFKAENLKDFFVETNFTKSIENYLNNYTNAGNFTILLKENFIERIKIKKVKIPLAFSIFADRSQEFINFLALLMVFDAEGNPSIDIQLPYVDKPKQNEVVAAELYKKTDKIKEFELLLLEPLNDIFYDDFEKNKQEIYSKLIANTTTKYVATIVSAYQIYINTNNIIPVLIYYNAAKKIIDKSTIPDTRQWSLLPANIRFNSVSVSSGEYVLKLKKNGKYFYEKKVFVSDKTFIDI